ncbi:hypothetical protein MHY87_06490 [Microvirga sp. ACRRW]|uniref:putative quinol monooxygenase n=1 Tax=Microvirga sp. ACRRW TaxID=2918205 RepID=UPI001EF47A95|nr:hypothetical protein [Microvirga sp. ACRRW]MCG7392550.1 hypothetical protein [Microvirga sp. ACRRW]
MYARLTTFRVKPDKVEDMRRWRDANEARIYDQPGLRDWIGLMDDKGDFVVVALFDDEAAAQAAMPQVRALWSEMAAMVEGVPTAKFLNVVAAKNAMSGVVMG